MGLSSLSHPRRCLCLGVILSLEISSGLTGGRAQAARYLASYESARIPAAAPTGPSVPQPARKTTSPGDGASTRPRRAAPTTHLLGTAFHASNQGGEISIKTSAPVELDPVLIAGPREAIFIIKNCRAPRRTDRLPLETRYFESPVTRVALSRRGADLRVVVSLRQKVGPALTRREAGPAGSEVWTLRFSPNPGSTIPDVSADQPDQPAAAPGSATATAAR